MIKAYIEQNQYPQILRSKFVFSFSPWRRFGKGCFRAAATANGKTGLGAAFPDAITARRRAVSLGDGLEEEHARPGT